MAASSTFEAGDDARRPGLVPIARCPGSLAGRARSGGAHEHDQVAVGVHRTGATGGDGSRGGGLLDQAWPGDPLARPERVALVHAGCDEAVERWKVHGPLALGLGAATGGA